MMNADPKTVKKGVVILVTVLMTIVILICIGLVLYYNRLLPTGLQDYINSVIMEKRLAKAENNNKSEQPFYTIEYELDLPDYDEIEIIDLANQNTMLAGTFSKSVLDKVSILKADNKYGLISNIDGELFIDAEYDSFIKTDDNVDLIYGRKGEKYDSINLNTLKIKKDVQLLGSAEGAYYYYDDKEDEVWTQTLETPDTTPEEKNLTDFERYQNIETTYALCTNKNQKGKTENAGTLYGYVDVETGLISIKPQFTKATLFQDGIAGVVKDGKGYYISEANAKLSDDYFEDVSGMHNFKSWIKKDGKWYLAYFPKLVERDEIYRSNKESKENKIVVNYNTVSNEVTNTTNTTNTVNKKYVVNRTYTVFNELNTTNDKNIIEP